MRTSLSSKGIAGPIAHRFSTACVSVIFSGCAMLSASNLPSNESELRTNTQNEGVVVGSVLLTVEGENSEHSYYGEDDSLLAGLPLGMETSGREFAVWAKLKSSGWSQYTFAVVAKPGEEALFIKKLPVGDYEMFALSPEGFPPEQNKSHMRLHKTFVVLPKQTTYIGKFAIELPYRFPASNETGGGSGSGIWDAEAETTSKLRQQFPATLLNVTKRLAAQSNFPFDQAISSDCIKVKKMMLKQRDKQADTSTAATQFCANVVQECTYRPRGDDCKKLVQSYDLRRFGSGPSLLMEVAGTNRRGDTGNIILMRYLLDIGYSPNARVGGPWTDRLMPDIARDEANQLNGNNPIDYLTPLMIASGVGDRRMVQMLLRAGADPNVQGQGHTARSLAELQGHAEIVSILKRYGKPQ